MADKPGTGGPGVFQRGGGSPPPTVDVPLAAPIEPPPQQTVVMLGLISRLQNVEGQLSALRQEKLTGERAFATGTTESSADLSAALTDLESCKSVIRQMESVLKTVLRFIEVEGVQGGDQATPGANNVAIGGNAQQIERGRIFITRIRSTIESAINFPQNF